MRYGVIADVHANLHALEAALAFLAGQDVDAYLCAGDLVGYGPMPNECVRRVTALPGLCVAGNHDLIALGRLSDRRCIPLARASLRWTREVLEDDARAMLSDLPSAASAGGIALRHGSISDPEQYVVTPEQALACLCDLERLVPAANGVIVGHTHRPMAFGRHRGTLLRGGTGTVRLAPGEPILLNPGAVGQSRSREVSARVMVLDLALRVATFHALPYDVAGCRRALREQGLPERSCHLPRSRSDEVAGVVGRAVHRARRAMSQGPFASRSLRP
ncbi:MAG: metallophosphoesterase family protein [Solirubrobacteraceae bacterium]